MKNCSLYFFETLSDDIIFWTSLGKQLTFFVFLVPLLWFPPWSMVIPTCFHTKIFSKCNFRTHYNVGSSTILVELLTFRIDYRTAMSSPSNLLQKLWIWDFWIILSFVSISLYKQFCRGMVENNPTKKQIDTEIQATLKYAPAWKLAEEKM